MERQFPTSPRVAAASEPERRSLSSDSATATNGTVSGASLVGQDIFDLLVMYFVVSVEVDPDDGAYVQVITNLSHAIGLCVRESR